MTSRWQPASSAWAACLCRTCVLATQHLCKAGLQSWVGKGVSALCTMLIAMLVDFAIVKRSAALYKKKSRTAKDLVCQCKILHAGCSRLMSQFKHLFSKTGGEGNYVKFR